MKYLPVDQGPSSAFDVNTRTPVKVTYDGDCTHPNPPVPYFMQDRRSEGMDRFYGTCCGDCGLILTRHELD